MGKVVGKYQGESSVAVLRGLKYEVNLSSMIVIIWSFWQLQKFCLMH
jgi:hypothetical protein